MLVEGIERVVVGGDPSPRRAIRGWPDVLWPPAEIPTLSPLLGSAGTRALLVRSAKLSQSRFSFLEAAVVESSTMLRECLQAQEAAVATESAAAVFGTFLALLTIFIGERLTNQALRRAWPTIEDMAPTTTEEDNQ